MLMSESWAERYYEQSLAAGVFRQSRQRENNNERGRAGNSQEKGQ
jgi:hypothetical protein